MENRRIIIGGSRINRRGTVPSPASHASHTSDRETPLLSDSTTNPKVPTLQPKPKSGTGPIVVASSLPRTKHATAPSLLSGTDDEAALLLLLRALVTLGADSTTHGSALHHAARSDRTAGCIPLLVQRNEASSPRSKVDSFASVANDRGQTPLHWAAYGNAVDAVCSLLEAGADVSATDKQGLTPMHVAAARGAVAVVKALLRDNGTVPLTDVLASRTFLALTPLHLAAEAGHSHVLALLLAHATDATMVARDPLGRNILHLAALGGHTRAVAAISSSPADVRLLHVVDDRGATPTCLAAALRHTDTLIHLIMRFGPDIADIPDTLAAHMNVDAIADVALLPLLGWKLDDDVVAGNAGDDNDDNDDNDDDEDFLDDEFRLDAAIHVLDLSLQRGWLRLVKLFVQHGVRPSRDGVSRATKEAAALLGDVAAVESEASRSPTIATIDLRPRAPLSVATRTSSGAHPPTPPPTPKARPEPPSGPRPERKTTGEMRAMLFGKDEKEKEKEKEKEREREEKEKKKREAEAEAERKRKADADAEAERKRKAAEEEEQKRQAEAEEAAEAERARRKRAEEEEEEAAARAAEEEEERAAKAEAEAAAARRAAADDDDDGGNEESPRLTYAERRRLRREEERKAEEEAERKRAEAREKRRAEREAARKAAEEEEAAIAREREERARKRDEEAKAKKEAEEAAEQAKAAAAKKERDERAEREASEAAAAAAAAKEKEERAAKEKEERAAKEKADTLAREKAAAASNAEPKAPRTSTPPSLLTPSHSAPATASPRPTTSGSRPLPAPLMSPTPPIRGELAADAARLESKLRAVARDFVTDVVEFRLKELTDRNAELEEELTFLRDRLRNAEAKVAAAAAAAAASSSSSSSSSSASSASSSSSSGSTPSTTTGATTRPAAMVRRDSSVRRELPVRPAVPSSTSPTGPSLRVAQNQLDDLERSLAVVPTSKKSPDTLTDSEKSRVEELSRTMNELLVTHARLVEQGKRAASEAQDTMDELQGPMSKRMTEVRTRLRALNPELESAKYTQSVNARRAFFESMRR